MRALAATEPVDSMPDRGSQQPGRTLLPVLFFVLLVLLPYGQVWQHEFVRFDDYEYIVENPIVREGLSWEGTKWALTTYHQANWHPLTWLSHMVDCQLFGLEPGWHHIINVMFHALNAVLLFVCLRFMTKAFWPSLLVAALFAVHPLRVESVAWAAERKDVLAGLFWMLTMLAYGRYARRPRLGRYALVFVCLGLGLMAKPMLVTLPFVLLLLDIWPLGRLDLTGRRSVAAARALVLLREKLPLMALAAASSLVTWLAQQSGGAFEKLEGLSLSSRFANALVAYVAYLWKTVWPRDLAFYYPHPAIVSTDPLSSLIGPAVGAGLLLALLTFLVSRSATRRPYLVVGWLWYLGTLLPVIGLFQVGNQSMADRYAYLPLVGIYILVAWGARDLTARWRRGRFVLAIPFLVLLPILSAVTWVQVGYWRNSLTLFQHALDATTDNYVAHNNLGNVFTRQGDLGQAAAHYEQALRIKPDLPEAQNNLGNALVGQGDPARAVAHYEEAIRLRPEYDTAHYNLGIALEAQGKLVQAMAHYERALRINPELAEAHDRLADMLAKRGDAHEAVSHYRQAVRLKPGLLHAAISLAWLLATSNDSSLRDGSEAVRWAEHCARAVGQGDPVVLNTLAAAYAEAGDLDEAVRWQARAVEVAPVDEKADFLSRLELYKAGSPYRVEDR